jgi:hypothetical protein
MTGRAQRGSALLMAFRAPGSIAVGYEGGLMGAHKKAPPLGRGEIKENA